MLYCSACGAELSGDDIFCPACGALVTSSAGTRTAPLPAPTESPRTESAVPLTAQTPSEPVVAPKEAVFRSTDLDCRFSPEEPEKKPRSMGRNLLCFSLPALCVGIAAGFVIGALVAPFGQKDSAVSVGSSPTGVSGSLGSSTESGVQTDVLSGSSAGDSSTISGTVPTIDELENTWVLWNKTPTTNDDPMFRLLSLSTDTVYNLNDTMYTGNIRIYYPDNRMEAYNLSYTYEDGVMTAYTYEAGHAGDQYLEYAEYKPVISDANSFSKQTLTLLAAGADASVKYTRIQDALNEFMPGEVITSETLSAHIWSRECGSATLPSTLRFSEMNIAYGDDNKRLDYYQEENFPSVLTISGGSDLYPTGYCASILTGSRFSVSSTFGTYLFLLDTDTFELTVYSSSDEIS